MEKKTLGSFIAVLRKANGMTQREMADRLSVSDKAISRWERDECSPDIALIPVIAEMFDISCDELLKGERFTESRQSIKSTEKVDKQIKYLLNTALSRYKAAIYIAMAGVAVGVILLFAISYGFYRPVIGFATLMIFVVGSVIVIFLSLNRLNIQTKNSELMDSIIKTDMVMFYKTKFLLTYCSLFISAMTIVWSLPFVIVRDKYIVDSVIYFYSYLRLVPSFAGITLILFGITYRFCKYFFLGKSYITTYDKNLKYLSIIQFVGTPLILLVISLLFRLISEVFTSWIQVSLIIMCIVVPLVPVIVVCMKKKSSLRLFVLIGVRNTGFIYSFLVFMSGLRRAVHYDLNGETIQTYIHLNQANVIIAVFILYSVTIFYLLLKKYLVKY